MVTPGRETSEWRITGVVVVLASVLAALQFKLPQGSALYALAGITLATSAALGYTASRTVVKVVGMLIAAFGGEPIDPAALVQAGVDAAREFQPPEATPSPINTGLERIQ